MYDWIIGNKEIFAGILTAAAAIVAAIITKTVKTDKNPTANTNSNVNNNTIILGGKSPVLYSTKDSGVLSMETARILFVDDDITFQVVKIIKKSGWCNVKAIKDVESLDAPVIKETDLFFIDIQGVGKALKFKDEGLGLAIALKNKYPHKKIVIYSAEPLGDRFHQGFRVADDFLSKTAEPYQFQQIIENLLVKKDGQ